MGNRRAPSYIALARSFIKDPRFRRPADRPLVETEAIIWLISEAAWRPRGVPTRFGAMHNDRAQLSTTQRALAKEWNWSRSKVRRFLAELVEDGMIGMAFARPRPKNNPMIGPNRGYERTIITFCNYDKFQGMPRFSGFKTAQKTAHETTQERLPLSDVADEIASGNKTTNESIIAKEKLAERTVNKRKPFHGALTRKGNVVRVWWDYGTQEWHQYAADYEAVRGATVLPVKYLDGGGRWFIKLGETWLSRHNGSLAQNRRSR